MIPTDGWKSMDDAPRDGTVIVAKFRMWGQRSGPVQVQAVQWFCDGDGANWTWRKPWNSPAMTVHADEWMTVAEFQAACAAEAFTTAPQEFDL